MEPVTERDETADEGLGAASVSVARRLELAMRLALARHVFVPDRAVHQRTCLRLLAALAPPDLAHADDLPAHADFLALTEPVIEADGRHVPNALWLDPAFLQPAVASLAQFWDRTLSPRGTSRLTLVVSPAPASLLGYRLEDLRLASRAIPHATAEDGEERDEGEISTPTHDLAGRDGLRVSTLLAAAADRVLAEEDWLTVATHHLLQEANRAGPAHQALHLPPGASPLVRLRGDPGMV